MSVACVIGSGPAGVASASALLQKGIPVLMLDAGIRLEPERQEVVDRMAAQDHTQWSEASLTTIKEGMSAGAKGLPVKRIYGSDFPYRDVERHLHYTQDPASIGLTPSLALGGYSNVWGAALLPYAEADLQGWPISREQLAPHYAAAEKITHITGRHDDLDEHFPAATPCLGQLQFSRQAAHFHENLTRHRDSLRHAGIHFGVSRLAVEANSKPACVHCGLCMYGCPYGLIFNSAATVKELCNHPGFQYRADCIVERVIEEGETVRICGRNRITSEPFEVQASRAYLAAGAIPTTRILLESLGGYNRTVSILDSQYFLLPLLFAKRAKDVHLERLHTMSQLFLEINDPKVSPHFVHLQAYTYSDMIGQALRSALGPLGKLDFLARQLESRIVILQGFIHSDHSSHIDVRLESAGGRLHLEASNQRQGKAAVHRVIAKLLRQAPRLGALPLWPMVQIAPVGRSFHCGGSFPMREHPGEFESDRLGRPSGLRRVHIVDATCFPSIPATTITLSAMANAHRISWETAGT